MPPSSLLTFSVLPNDELVLFSEVVPPSEPVHHLVQSYRHSGWIQYVKLPLGSLVSGTRLIYTVNFLQ